jgi:chromosome segregation ATPase
VVASLRAQLDAARDEAAGARQLLFEAQEAGGGLQARADALEQELSDARVEIEWLEGKVSDLEAGQRDTPQVRLGAQACAAARRPWG